jgi:hypothetical protein
MVKPIKFLFIISILLLLPLTFVTMLVGDFSCAITLLSIIAIAIYFLRH